MPGAVRTVEAQLHVKEHPIFAKLALADGGATEGDESFVQTQVPPTKAKGGKEAGGVSSAAV